MKAIKHWLVAGGCGLLAWLMVQIWTAAIDPYIDAFFEGAFLSFACL